MRFKILATREALLATRERWEALWHRSRGDTFLSFTSCLLSWDELHAPRGRRLFCALAFEGDELVALLPLVIHRKGLWRIASFCGPEAAEGCDMLVARDPAPAAASELLRFAMRARRADVLDLAFVRSGGPLADAVRRSKRFHAVAHADTSPYALLENETEWAGYERSLGRGTQSQVARKRRRMEEAGRVEVERIDGRADGAIDWLLDEKARWGRKVGKVGPWLFSPAYRAYLKAFAAASGPTECVSTFILRFDGEIAAAKVIAIGANACSLIIAAFDEDLGRFSPGNILDEVWIRHVFDTYRDAAGRHLNIDFGTGVERYKLHWSRGFGLPSKSFKIAATRWGEVPYRIKSAMSRIPSRSRTQVALPD